MCSSSSTARTRGWRSSGPGLVPGTVDHGSGRPPGRHRSAGRARDAAGRRSGRRRTPRDRHRLARSRPSQAGAVGQDGHGMTLRLRLVLALVALVAVGLAVFGVATYARVLPLAARAPRRSARALRAVRDRQAVRPDRPAAGMTAGAAARRQRPRRAGAVGHRPGRRWSSPSGTYAELRDPDGAVVATIQPCRTRRQPDLPARPDPAGAGTGLADAPARQRAPGGGGSRSPPSDHGDGNTVVVAVPMDELDASLRRLVLIEARPRSSCSPPWPSGPG